MLKSTKLSAVLCITLTVLMGYVNTPALAEVLTWDYYWDAWELPEAYQNSTVFLYDGTVPAQVTRGVENGIYTATTAGEGVPPAINASYVTRPDVFDPSLPSTIEFRINVQETVEPRCLLLLIQQQGVGELGFDFKADNNACFVYGSGPFVEPYQDEEGWTTFRVLTYVTSFGEQTILDKAELYYLDGDGQWVLGVTSLLYVNMKMPGSRFRIGDLTTGWGGTWSEDYVCWTQQGATLEEINVSR